MKIRMKENVNIYAGITQSVYISDGAIRDDDDNLAKYFISQGWAEEVREPTYVPYKHVSEDWVGKTIRVISRPLDVYIITGICGNDLYVSGRFEYTLRDMLNNFTWADGSPFGEVDNGDN